MEIKNHLNFKFLNNVFGWIAFAIATFVYLLTVERTASFWDCGEFIACAYKLQVPHPPGAPFFLLIGRMFSLLAGSDVTQVAFWINVSSALASGFTILFLFWTITLFGVKLFPHQKIEKLSDYQIVLLLLAGTVGSLSYAFTDSFWFSAVEAEVYALSSFFAALVIWAVLKWEVISDPRRANQWLVLIAYIVGLSTGIHLLNLVTLPALALIYYYKNYKKPTPVGVFVAMGIGVVLVLLIMEGVIAGLPTIAGNFEIFFVNNLGSPIGVGIVFFIVLLIGGLVFGIQYSIKKQKVTLNTALLSVIFILIGYATYGIVAIRANYNPPINENDPSDILKFVSYLKREQYGSRPLLYGPSFASDVKRDEEGRVIKNFKGAVYRFVKEKGKYEIYDKKEDYVYEDNLVLPRIYSRSDNHKELYLEKLYGADRVQSITKELREGTFKPTMSDNIKFLFEHQLNYMYWRYFAWNFISRESDNDGSGSIPVFNQKDLPASITTNKAHNNYYGIPFILGCLGLAFCLMRSLKTSLITFLLFLMTGIALVIYLNSPPVEPRERDYIYVGSFYAFAIWIGFAMIAIPELLGMALLKKDGTSPKLVPSQALTNSTNTVNIGLSGLLGIMCISLLLFQNYDDHNRSNRYHSIDSAKNLLESCAPNSIIFTGGDNDTFPLWYVQEVEGFRTDVRVCNLSLLGTDWYIDQMKRATYKSQPLPLSLKQERYLPGRNESILFPTVYRLQTNLSASQLKDMASSGMNIKTYLKLINDNDKRVSAIIEGSDETVTILPSKKLYYKFDRENAKKIFNISSDKDTLLKDFMLWDLKANEISKSELMVLDMIAQNDWKRPIYFSSTLGSSSYMGLKEYMRLEGLAYRLMPYKIPGATDGFVDTKLMQDNMMKKFHWRELANPNAYYYETYFQFVLNVRNSFAKLGIALLNEGKKEEAKKVVLFCLDKIPDKAIPYDIYTPRLVGVLLESGEEKKAMEIANILLQRANEDLTFYIDNRPSYESVIQTQLAILSQLNSVMQEAGKLELAKKIENTLKRHYDKVK